MAGCSFAPTINSKGKTREASPLEDSPGLQSAAQRLGAQSVLQLDPDKFTFIDNSQKKTYKNREKQENTVERLLQYKEKSKVKSQIRASQLYNQDQFKPSLSTTKVSKAKKAYKGVQSIMTERDPGS